MAKDIRLLYKRERASSMLEYHYDVHKWRYDNKFWLFDEVWCTDIDGLHSVGKLQDSQNAAIRELASIIDQREKENHAWICFNQCRKRTCICKVCKRLCKCGSCDGKIASCENYEKLVSDDIS